jgi:thiol-disulfide isomerase/thioredoxin
MMKLNKKFMIAVPAVLIAVIILSLIATGNEKKSTAGNNVKNKGSSVKRIADGKVEDNASKTNGKGTAAIEKAAKAGKYIFVLFYKNKNEQTRKMKESLSAVVKEHANRARLIEIDAAAASEQDIVKKFDLSRAPMPLVLAIAPNGAVTGGFPQKVTSEQLEKCFVSKLIMKVLKPMQEGKVVLVLLQNSSTRFNSESAKAAGDFAVDKKLNGFVEIIRQDPLDSEAKDFLEQCKLDKKILQATIVFLVPPGRIAGIFPGKTTKKTLMAALASCSGGSCKPGSCSPKSCPPIKK